MGVTLPEYPSRMGSRIVPNEFKGSRIELASCVPAGVGVTKALPEEGNTVPIGVMLQGVSKSSGRLMYIMIVLLKLMAYTRL